MSLKSLKSMLGYTVHSDSKPVGIVHNFYFDDQYWKLRYVVIATSGIFSRKLILVPAWSIRSINEARKSIDMLINTAQLEHGAGVHYDRPVSKQIVKALIKTDNFIAYLPTDNDQLPNWLVKLLKSVDLSNVVKKDQLTTPNPHLRSLREVIGYDVKYNNEKVTGSVEDLLIQSNGLQIYGLLNDTGGSVLGANSELLSTEAVERISWEDHAVSFVLSPIEQMSRIAYSGV